MGAGRPRSELCLRSQGRLARQIPRWRMAARISPRRFRIDKDKDKDEDKVEDKVEGRTKRNNDEMERKMKWEAESMS